MIDVLVIGGGIAGWSAGYHARLLGHEVVVVDAGMHRASDLPLALVNPLRGKHGRLVARGIEGMRATFATIAALRDAGHVIPAGQGLYRPLIEMPSQDHAAWRSRLPDDLGYDWHDPAPASLGVVDPVPALYLHEAGWVEPRAFLDALAIESRADVIADEVVDFDGDTGVRLASGTTLHARHRVWCGGAWGAARLDGPVDTDALYKPGCLLTVAGSLTRDVLSFGLYAAPLGTDTVIGPTREHGTSRYPDDAIPPDAVARLQDRIGELFGRTIAVSTIWRGVRLVRPSSRVSARLAGVPAITALGSRGFLLAPLFAAEWARSL